MSQSQSSSIPDGYTPYASMDGVGVIPYGSQEVAWGTIQYYVAPGRPYISTWAPAAQWGTPHDWGPLNRQAAKQRPGYLASSLNS